MPISVKAGAGRTTQPVECDKMIEIQSDICIAKILIRVRDDCDSTSVTQKYFKGRSRKFAIELQCRLIPADNQPPYTADEVYWGLEADEPLSVSSTVVSGVKKVISYFDPNISTEMYPKEGSHFKKPYFLAPFITTMHVFAGWPCPSRLTSSINYQKGVPLIPLQVIPDFGKSVEKPEYASFEGFVSESNGDNPESEASADDDQFATVTPENEEEDDFISLPNTPLTPTARLPSFSFDRRPDLKAYESSSYVNKEGAKCALEDKPDLLGPAHFEDPSYELREDTAFIFGIGQEKTGAERRKIFSSRAKRKEFRYDPDIVYAASFFSPALDLSTSTAGLGPFKLNLRSVYGSQPLRFVLRSSRLNARGEEEVFLAVDFPLQ